MKYDNADIGTVTHIGTALLVGWVRARNDHGVTDAELAALGDLAIRAALIFESKAPDLEAAREKLNAKLAAEQRTAKDAEKAERKAKAEADTKAEEDAHDAAIAAKAAAKAEKQQAHARH